MTIPTLDEVLRLYQAQTITYTAHPRYLAATSWAHTGLEEDYRAFELRDAKGFGSVESIVFGIINYDDILMEAHGNCKDPAELSDANFQFSISAPTSPSSFYSAYAESINNFYTLAEALDEDIELDRNVYQFLKKSDGGLPRLTFRRSIFRASSVRQKFVLRTNRVSKNSPYSGFLRVRRSDVPHTRRLQARLRPIDEHSVLGPFPRFLSLRWIRRYS